MIRYAYDAFRTLNSYCVNSGRHPKRRLRLPVYCSAALGNLILNIIKEPVSVANVKSLLLTHSTPAVPNCCCFKGSAP